MDLSRIYLLFPLLVLASLVGAQYETIVDIALDTPELASLLSLLTSAGLDQTFAKDDVNYTLFAPTDEAIADFSSSAATAKYMEPEYEAWLTDLLLYHATNSSNLVYSFQENQKVLMLNNEEIEITSIEPYTIDYTAFINTPDNVANNGVVHIINSTLIPPSMKDDILSRLSNRPASFGTLNTFLMLSAELDGRLDLNGAGPFTLYAPTNAAILRIPDDYFGWLVGKSPPAGTMRHR